jgi:hypothetical protein
MLITDVVRSGLVDEINNVRYLVISQEVLEALERSDSQERSGAMNSLIDQLKASRHPTLQGMFCIPISQVEALPIESRRDASHR